MSNNPTTPEERAREIRGKYMTMSYNIEPNGDKFPINYRHYIERLEVLLYDRESENTQLKEALSVIIESIDFLNLKDAQVTPIGALGNYFELVDKAVTKAKELLTDKE